MDRVSLAFNIAALTLSLVALTISAAFAIQQLATMRQANLVPVIIQHFQEFQNQGLLDHMDYVINELYRNYPPALGFSKLPSTVRAHVTAIGYFYEGMGFYATKRG
jgi:hypothetical protein